MTESNSVMELDGHAPVVALDHTAPEVAAAICVVMQDAYRVEAAIIGVADFVPLCRTAADIAATDARFRGIRPDGDLTAVIELSDEGPGPLQIDALVVSPAHFRRGLASALLRDAIDRDPSRALRVSTAVANAPALELYRAHGFRETGRRATPDGIPMVTLLRGAGAGATSTGSGDVR